MGEDFVEVELWERGRRQRVYFSAEGAGTRLWSVVAGAAHVTSTDLYWRELAKRIWRRNAVSELVAFGFDGKDRLIGFIEHSARAPSDEDLAQYVEAVAHECDHLEYLLFGKDAE